MIKFVFTVPFFYSKSLYNKYFLRINLKAAKPGCQLALMLAADWPDFNCSIKVALPANLLKK